MLQSIHLLPTYPIFNLSYSLLKPSISPSLTFLHKPTSTHSLHSHLHTNSEPWLHLADAELPEPPISVVPTTPTPPQDGPIELSPDMPSIFATDDNPTPLQVSTSVLLTGAITVFLFRALRRRAKRAKELRMRSSGAKKTMKEEALDNLKAMGTVALEPKGPPSPVQALLGGITAGVIALILYKFTTTIESALNRQTISDNYSALLRECLKLYNITGPDTGVVFPTTLALHLYKVRQITITIRTIINGLCYLATFVFGINSVGLFLYSGQLALNSIFDDSTSNDAKPKDGNESSPPNTPSARSNTTETNDRDQTS